MIPAPVPGGNLVSAPQLLAPAPQHCELGNLIKLRQCSLSGSSWVRGSESRNFHVSSARLGSRFVAKMAMAQQFFFSNCFLLGFVHDTL